MKKEKFNTKTAKLVAKMATNTLKTEANAASCLVLFQPKAPKELERFKKK